MSYRLEDVVHTDGPYFVLRRSVPYEGFQVLVEGVTAAHGISRIGYPGAIGVEMAKQAISSHKATVKRIMAMPPAERPFRQYSFELLARRIREECAA